MSKETQSASRLTEQREQVLKRNSSGRGSYGKELILDLHGCENSKFTRHDIEPLFVPLDRYQDIALVRKAEKDGTYVVQTGDIDIKPGSMRMTSRTGSNRGSSFLSPPAIMIERTLRSISRTHFQYHALF